MKWMIANGYADARTLERRIDAMEAWLANPQLLQAATPTPNTPP